MRKLIVAAFVAVVVPMIKKELKNQLHKRIGRRRTPAPRAKK